MQYIHTASIEVALNKPLRTHLYPPIRLPNLLSLSIYYLILHTFHYVQTQSPPHRRPHQIQPRHLRPLRLPIRNHPPQHRRTRPRCLQTSPKRAPLGRLRRHLPPLLEHRRRNGSLGRGTDLVAALVGEDCCFSRCRLRLGGCRCFC